MSGFVGAISGNGDGAIQALRRMTSSAPAGEGEPVRQSAARALVAEPRLSETLPPLPPPESQALQQGSSQSLQHGEPQTLKHAESTHTGQVDTYA